MLQQIRDNASGPIAYGVVALITLVFGVWGIGSYFTESSNPVVASAGGTDISKYQLQQAYDQRYQRLQQLMGDNFKHDMVKPDQFRRQVLDSLIDQSLLTQYAQDNGYRVPDKAVLAKLRSDKRFQVDGHFSAQRYRAMLGQAGISPAAFESNLRGDLKSSQLRRAILGTSFVSDRELGLASQLENQRRKLVWLRFDPAAFKDQVKVSDDQVAAYYHTHPQDFLTPERVKLAYVEVDRSKLGASDKPDEKALRALYEQDKNARFKTPERRKARQILIRVDKNTSADAAREKIQQLAQKLDNGASFAKLAEQYSDDKASAKKGGEIGWVTRGSMIKGFEDKLFSMAKVGQVSTPVRTDFGWHLIKLEKIDPAKVKPFDDPDVQRELTSLYSSQARDQAYRQRSDKLDSLSFEAPNSLQPIAKQLDLKIQHSGWIARGKTPGEGLGQYAPIRKAAFSDSVLKDGLNSTSIQLAGDRRVVLRVDKHEAAKQRPLKDVSDQIRATLRNQAAAEKAHAAAQKALQAARNGQPLSKLADQDGGALKQAGWVSRKDDKLDEQLRNALFAMPQPQDEQPSYAQATASDGASAVLQLAAVKNQKPDASQRATLARQVRGRNAGLEYAAVRASIRSDYKVKINENRLN